MRQVAGMCDSTCKYCTVNLHYTEEQTGDSSHLSTLAAKPVCIDFAVDGVSSIDHHSAKSYGMYWLYREHNCYFDRVK